MKSFLVTTTKETKFNRFLQEKVGNLNKIRGGEDPPDENPTENPVPPPPPPPPPGNG